MSKRGRYFIVAGLLLFLLAVFLAIQSFQNSNETAPEPTTIVETATPAPILYTDYLKLNPTYTYKVVDVSLNDGWTEVQIVTNTGAAWFTLPEYSVMLQTNTRECNLHMVDSTLILELTSADGSTCK